ncbi:hypothetical protein FRC02_008127 [Tulasnella sp. 418]|nr:hypothetical protein FRC02_008127 [Tulasnella sp. 418]
MRPLMMPDPHCASCNSTFVEEINVETSPENDPRRFQEQVGPGGYDDGEFLWAGNHIHQDPLISLMNILMANMGTRNQAPGRIGSPLSAGSNGTTFHFGSGGRGGSITFTSMSRGGSAMNNSSSRGVGVGDGGEAPELMETGRGGPLHPLANILAILAGGSPMGNGQVGDYAFDQQALDDIVTRLMETSQGPRPVPAPDEMIDNLPRTSIPADSPLLQKDCAICKESFQPTESQSIITLPCNPNQKYAHSFHEDCILPWIRQNGTCPVCRYQLVPQPEQHSHPPQPPQEGNRERESSSTGVGRGIWDFLTRGGSRSTVSRSGNENNENQAPGDSSSTAQRNSRPGPNSNSNVPGSWDTVD